MSCACRATPVKIFIQGLKQVHKIDNTSSLLRLRSPLPTQSVRYHDGFAFARQTRMLHASGYLNQEASSDGPVSTTSSTEPSASSSKDTSTESSPKTTSNSGSYKPRSRGYSNTSRAPTRQRDLPDNVSREIPFKRLSMNRTREERAEEPEDAEVQPERVEPPAPYQSKESLWKSQKAALKKKFPDGWRPRKRLSPDALAGIRALNAQFPDTYDTPALANKFEVSPEVIRRILRSKWVPSAEEEEDRNERWFRRGKTIWAHQAALGVKPPQKWRREGIARDPSYHAWRKEAIKRNRDAEDKDSDDVFGDNFSNRRRR